MSDDLVKLRELAKAATPYCPAGKWYYGSGDRTYHVDGPLCDINSDDDREFAIIYTRVEMPALAEYLAAATPQTVIALLDRLEALKRLCEYAQHKPYCSASIKTYAGESLAACSCGLAELRGAGKP